MSPVLGGGPSTLELVLAVAAAGGCFQVGVEGGGRSSARAGVRMESVS